MCISSLSSVSHGPSTQRASCSSRATALEARPRAPFASDAHAPLHARALLVTCTATPTVADALALALALALTLALALAHPCSCKRAGSLAQALVAQKTVGWPLSKKLRIAAGLADGLAFLHVQVQADAHATMSPYPCASVHVCGWA